MAILNKVTQLIDGVDIVTAKDIMDTQETAIKALEKANEMSGDVYDDTEIRGLINAKASLDASNLSTSNVEKWKEKLGVGEGGTKVIFAYYD